MAINEHECFIPLEFESTLWRYLDFEKFQSLLKEKALFFCRTDKFSDPFEGSIPALEAEYRIKAMQSNAIAFGRDFNDDLDQKNILALQKLHQKLKRGTTINCWHINSEESDAMWRLYLKDNEGVAIQTSMRKMHEVIGNANENIGLSKVRYLNYDTDGWFDPKEYPHQSYNLYIPLVHKRIEFKHEKEFRLIHDVSEAVENDAYWDDQPNNKGKFIKVDIENLIESVYLPPTIDPHRILKVENMTKSLGYNFQFKKSRLSSEPIF